MDAPPAAMRTRVSVSGTCSTQTTTFMASSCSGFVALEEQRAVRATEAERVAEHVAQPGLARLVRHAVEVALGVLILDVDRRRDQLVPERERRDPGLEPAGRAEQVSRHRLRRAERQRARMLAEDPRGRRGAR